VRARPAGADRRERGDVLTVKLVTVTGGKVLTGIRVCLEGKS
jgi:hypothetical protein